MPGILVVFSHFDIDDIIDDYVIYYLKKLREVAADIVFVSTASIAEHEKSKIEKICTKIIVKDNTGYDFMSYRVGLLESGLDYTAYDQVVICNDSVYGPLFDMKSVFSKMKSNSCSFWGITKCNQIENHVQSYFIVFKEKIIREKCLDKFFSNIECLPSKEDIIRQYEVGLSKYLHCHQYTSGAFCNYPNLIERIKYFISLQTNKNHRHENDNNTSVISTRYWTDKLRDIKRNFKRIILSDKADLTLVFWMYLIKEKNPFIKVRTLRSYLSVSGRRMAIKMLKKGNNYPVAMIEAHLVRTSGRYSGYKAVSREDIGDTISIQTGND